MHEYAEPISDLHGNEMSIQQFNLSLWPYQSGPSGFSPFSMTTFEDEEELTLYLQIF